MRNFKKFAAMASAAVLAACAAAPVLSFAVDGDVPVQPATDPITGSAIEYAVKVNSAVGSTHADMAAYQILTGSVDANDVLEVTGWGNGVNVSDFIAALKVDTTVGEDFKDLDSSSPQTSAVEFAKIMAGYGDKSAKANAVAKVAARNLETASGTFDDSDTTIKYVKSGYYIVVDVEAAELNNYTASTLGLLKVAGKDVEINAKVDFPSFDKQIGDINDTDGGNATFNESADWDMGDEVPFKLIATIPSNIDQYDTYKMIFHDDIQGNVFNLVMNGDELKYTVTYYESATDTTGTDVTSAFTYDGTAGAAIADATYCDGEDFTLTCKDIKAIEGVAAGGKFVVDYSATLTTSAKMGAAGNWNSAYLEYSNNPNFSGGGQNDKHDTGDSTVDSVVAFTYQTVVNKVDQNNAPLAGAEFTLYKEVATGGELGSTFMKADGTTSAGLAANKKYIEITSIKTTAGTEFAFNGLDDGDYVLVETKTPNSYNSAANLEFTIEAVHVQTDGDEKLESLSGGNDLAVGNVYTLKNTAADGEPVNNVLSDEEGADNGSLSATVINKYGSALPSTGGIGTKLFYLGGGAMVAVAGVFLITKKRMGKAEK